MNRGLLGMPSRPSATTRQGRLIADDASLGGAAVARVPGVAGFNDGYGTPHLVASIKNVPSVASLAYCPSVDRMIAASSSASGQCFVLHPARHEVVARFRVGGPAARVLIDPLTGLVVVARADGVLAFVDPSSWRVVRLLATGVASLAGAVFADRRGTIVLHGLAGGAEVNTLTRVVTPFVIAEDAQATIYHPDMDVFWVASSGSPSTVFAYGPATLTGAYVPASFALLAPFVAFALSSVNGLVYTAVSGSDSVQVLPTDSSDVVLGGGVATAIAENPRTKRLYVGMTGVGGVSVVNPAGFLAIVSSYQRCALPGGAPTTMAFCPSNGLMYAATAASSIVSAVS